MWIPKWVRDRKKGVCSPVPTQVVSNGELTPRPQTRAQKQVEALTAELAEDRAKRLGMDRRSFMATGMGMATCFLAANRVFGNYWLVDEEETLDEGAYESKWPKGQYFIFDVQAHFTNGYALGFRNQDFVKRMGMELDSGVGGYAFPTFVKEMFLDSETSMLVISGIPGKEQQYDRNGKPLVGPERGGGILPSWLMSKRKKELNELAGSQRALCQGNCAPNHYWNQAENAPDWNALYEQMEREVKEYGIDSWKWYCHTDPGRSGGGFTMDDEKLAYPFYAKSRELGVKTLSVHKGFSYQSKTLGHLANPKDVEKAALDHPDFSFVVYHSALQHGPGEPEFQGKFDPQTGDFAWHDVLMNIKRRNPSLNNVYPEIGSSFGLLAVYHPEMCQHLIGRNVQVYGADHVVWGTDCLWWGSPQWMIEAFKRFQITDEMCDTFGYRKLTEEDKAQIFGLNAARIYGVDAAADRKNLPADVLQKLKVAYLEEGGQSDHAAYGLVRNDV